MPTFIAKPTQITAAGNKPKIIQCNSVIQRLRTSEVREEISHLLVAVVFEQPFGHQ